MDDDHAVLEERGNNKLPDLMGNKIDIVLTDLAMPMMNGDKFAQVVKRMHPGIPVVMQTGFAEMLHDSEFSSSVDIVISKPVSPPTLREAFEQVLPAA